VNADARNHRRNKHIDVSERSQSTTFSRVDCGTSREIRHTDWNHDRRYYQSQDDQESATMDSQEPRYAFTGMEPLPISDDDDEIVTVGRTLPNVVHVEAVDLLTLLVRFDDGIEGKVRFEDTYLKNIWSILRDPEYFKQVGIQHGAVSWPNECPDMCPDTMHDEIVKHHGEWVLQ
jgi:hypothetical protein